MDRFKHIVTYECNKHCLYCINNYLPHLAKDGEVLGNSVRDCYHYMNHYYDFKHIILTGGEPTLCEDLQEYINHAAWVFPKVTLQTANPKVLTGEIAYKHLTDIMYSIHGPYEPIDIELAGGIKITTPVYASMLVQHYRTITIPVLLRAGFSGLTVRERWPDGQTLRIPLTSYINFSVKYTKKESCNQGYLMLPNNTLISAEVLNR